MAWQEEVRRLDEDLAAGRISADEHQRRRNELTAQPGTPEPGDQGGPGNPPDEGAGPPDSPPEPADTTRNSPFPPAFRWDNTPSEATQVINPIGNSDAERTQVVRTPEPPPGPSYDDAERTQVVQAGPPAPPRFGPPAQPDSGGFAGADDPWSQQDDQWSQQESAPPWVQSDPVQDPHPGWMLQGPESFEAEPRESGTMRIVAVAAAVVVLLGVAVGAWFLFGRGDTTVAEPQPATQQQAPPPPTTTEPPEDPLAPADVGGVKEIKPATTFQDVEVAGFLTGAEKEAFRAADAGQSRLLITNFPEGKATILVARTASSASSVTATDQLSALQVDYGFAERSGPPGTDSFELLGKVDKAPILRALYASRGLVVRIEMTGNAPGADPAAVIAKFDQVLTRQLEKLPADV